MTIWLALAGLTSRDSVLFAFGYNGTPEPTLGESCAGGTFQSGNTYVFCPSVGTASSLGTWGQSFSSLFPGGGGAGSWTLGISLDGSASPMYTISFTILSSGGNSSPAIVSVATADAGPAISQNDFIVIKGVNLVPANTPASGAIWSSAPSFASGLMPTQLGGISVTVNNKAALRVLSFAAPPPTRPARRTSSTF